MTWSRSTQNEDSDEDEFGTVLCSRKVDHDRITGGIVSNSLFPCRDCGETCVISPETLKVVDGKKWKPLCTHCIKNHPEIEEQSKKVELTPGQIEEMRKNLSPEDFAGVMQTIEDYKNGKVKL